MQFDCDVCGNKAHKAVLETGQFFCTQTCYAMKARCVPHYDIYNTAKNNRLIHNVMYTDENIQLVMTRLKKGESIGDALDASRPEVHPTSTQIIHVLYSAITVYLYNDDMQPIPKFLDSDNDGDDVIIIPPGKYHRIVNTSDSGAAFISYYSPSVH